VRQSRRTPGFFRSTRTQLSQLNAAFTQLDAYRSEEAELASACDEIANEERAFLESPNGSEKQATEKLLRIRATRDIRNAKLSNMKSVSPGIVT
jgi:hypothetical protein